MQAKSIECCVVPYDEEMQAGRPRKTTKSDFAERLTAFREAAGLSQRQMATRLGISQPSYVLWEQRNVSLRADQVLQLSNILGVSVEELYDSGKNGKRRGGPQGRARRTFETVSKLSQHQQKKILDVVDALLAQSNGSK